MNKRSSFFRSIMTPQVQCVLTIVLFLVGICTDHEAFMPNSKPEPSVRLVIANISGFLAFICFALTMFLLLAGKSKNAVT